MPDFYGEFNESAGAKRGMNRKSGGQTRKLIAQVTSYQLLQREHPSVSIAREWNTSGRLVDIFGIQVPCQLTGVS